MNFNLFADQIKVLFQIAHLELRVESRFSSLNSDYRLRIRQDIIQNYSSWLSTAEKNEILNLNLLPVGGNLFFSISHNKSLGGYAVCDQKVGFDLEEIGRLSNETIHRICSSKEVTLCPNVKLLWSAKESSVKIFKQDLLMSDIEILSWTKQDVLFHFEADCKKLNQKIKGAVTFDTFFSIACAFIN